MLPDTPGCFDEKLCRQMEVICATLTPAQKTYIDQYITGKQCNSQAFPYLRRRHLAGSVIAKLTANPARHFPDAAAWHAHLDDLGVTQLKVQPDPMTIATEGALWAPSWPDELRI